MARKLGAAIRRQWAGYLSLFLVVAGGTAYATHEEILSADIVNGQVKTADIATTAVTSPKIAANAVGTGKVIDGSLGRPDLAIGSLVPYGGGALSATESGKNCISASNCPLVYNRNVTSVTNPDVGHYCITVAGASPTNAAMFVQGEETIADTTVFAHNTNPGTTARICGGSAFLVTTFARTGPTEVVPNDHIDFSFTVVP